jgi:hypothetical protein
MKVLAIPYPIPSDPPVIRVTLLSIASYPIGHHS